MGLLIVPDWPIISRHEIPPLRLQFMGLSFDLPEEWISLKASESALSKQLKAINRILLSSPISLQLASINTLVVSTLDARHFKSNTGLMQIIKNTEHAS